MRFLISRLLFADLAALPTVLTAARGGEGGGDWIMRTLMSP
ncbi:hypothetical protein ABIA31_006563 [Catenulispora sp. MAP5-51]